MNTSEFRAICNTLQIPKNEVENALNTRTVCISRTQLVQRVQEECRDFAHEFLKTMYGSDSELVLDELLTRLTGHETNLLHKYSPDHAVWFGIHDVRIAIAVVAAEVLDSSDVTIDRDATSLLSIRGSLHTGSAQNDNDLLEILYQRDHLALTIARVCDFEVSLAQ